MSFLDPIFNPLLNLHPVLVIVIISLSITIIMTWAYKLFTNQHLMKSLKDEMKSLQNEAKEHSKNPEKAAEASKKMMEKNFEYMKHSMKPTLITMIPILLIIGWLSAHLSFNPLLPGELFQANTTADLTQLTLESKGLTILSNATQFSTDGKFSWNVKGDKGEYILGFSSNNTYAEKKILISDKQEYENPLELVKNSQIKTITIGNSKLRPFGSFSLFGWQPGWLGIYIIISIVSSMALRKAFNIH